MTEAMPVGEMRVLRRHAGEANDEDDGQQGLKDPGDDTLPQWGSHNVLPPLSHLVLSRMPRIWMELMMTKATSTISESAAAIPRSFLESKAKL